MAVGERVGKSRDLVRSKMRGRRGEVILRRWVLCSQSFATEGEVIANSRTRAVSS